MAYIALTALEQIFWHCSVAIHHLQAALDHAHAREVLMLDEYRALEATGHEICDVMNRLTTMWEDDTAAMDDPPC